MDATPCCSSGLNRPAAAEARDDSRALSMRLATHCYPKLQPSRSGRDRTVRGSLTNHRKLIWLLLYPLDGFNPSRKKRGLAALRERRARFPIRRPNTVVVDPGSGSSTGHLSEG